MSDRDQKTNLKEAPGKAGSEKLGTTRPRFEVGMAAVLAQSETVSRAFGRRLGFSLMVLAILAGSSVTATSLFLLTKGIGHFF
ncbi:hypothetical protein [Bradyrhizobium macuxiense]|uniref:hypothetical protein n=1 Tax=Bradyrhizobium macuxiense TaxID=1755647 RepID=UPI000A8E2422|nr:hypothetical protein [Bradyrhizobium macuxiense]